MSDRLAGYRAQQQTPSRYASDYRTPSGYDARRTNPYAHQDSDHYEMAEVHRSTDNLTAGLGGADSSSAFYAEISSLQDALKDYTSNIATINDLHTRSLNSTDEATSKKNTAQLEALIDQTSKLSNDLKRRIQNLERRRGSGGDAASRSQQIAFVKSKFVQAIQDYQQVEQQYRGKYKQRIERQFKIVKPDATPEEIQAVVDDEQGGQIFTQDLLNSNRYGDSRAAYREVQARHADIKKIEKTLVELAQLFNDMSIIVEQQEEAIHVIHDNAVKVDTDIEVGLEHTEKAVESARGARKKRWICFVIILIVILVIAIIALVHFHPWSR